MEGGRGKGSGDWVGDEKERETTIGGEWKRERLRNGVGEENERGTGGGGLVVG